MFMSINSYQNLFDRLEDKFDACLADARMLVVAFSVTATTTGIAILGFHATVITLRVLASLVMNHADFLAMDAFAALTAVVAFVAVPAVLAIVLVTAFGTGFGLALLLGRRALLFRILLFAGLPIGLATLIGTLVGAPLAIVGSTLFAGFGTLLLMQPRVLFATLVVALLRYPLQSFSDTATNKID